MNLSAWWSAWKYVAILSLLLVLSLYVIVIQWADHRAYKKGEAQRMELAAERTANRMRASMAKDATADQKALMAELAGIAERARKPKIMYAKAKAAAPLAAVCAPGQARIDAVNAGADR